MDPHDYRSAITKGLCKGIAFFGRINVPAIIMNRDTGAKDRAVMHHRHIGYAGNAQRGCHRGMQMGHGVNIRTSPVNRCVDVNFRRNDRILIQGHAVEIGSDNILRTQTAAAGTPGIDQNLFVIVRIAQTDMPAEIDQSQVFQHPNAGCQLRTDKIFIHDGILLLTGRWWKTSASGPVSSGWPGSLSPAGIVNFSGPIYSPL
jgi:hypothetical protein